MAHYAHYAHYGPLCGVPIVRIAARYAPLAGPLPNSQALFCLFVSFYTPWVGGGMAL